MTGQHINDLILQDGEIFATYDKTFIYAELVNYDVSILHMRMFYLMTLKQK
jgi:hypothetical protein